MKAMRANPLPWAPVGKISRSQRVDLCERELGVRHTLLGFGPLKKINRFLIRSCWAIARAVPYAEIP